MRTASNFAIEDGGTALRLNWSDGSARILQARLLWLQCPSALGRRQRIDGVRKTAPRDIRIVRLTPIGNYGLNIVFSDGHDKGIFPWTYLDELVPRLESADFIIS